jgi:hypothetical protein
LAIAIRSGARDLADDASANRSNLPHREYHHLFPNAVLTRDGKIEASEAYKSLNCALITWRTNRKISAKSPLKYLRERAEASQLGDDAVRERLRSHLIPFDELSEAGWDGIANEEMLRYSIRADYERFLKVRAELLIGPIEDLAEGKAPVEHWLTSL